MYILYEFMSLADMKYSSYTKGTVVLLAVLALCSCAGYRGGTPTPQAVGGVLDLKDWNSSMMV